MEDDKKQVEQARKQFLDEFVKIKFIIETKGRPKSVDKGTFIGSIRRILGL